MDCSPPGSSVHGILQAGILEWVAIPFSRDSPQRRDRTQVSCIGRQILYHWATWEALILDIFAWVPPHFLLFPLSTLNKQPPPTLPSFWLFCGYPLSSLPGSLLSSPWTGVLMHSPIYYSGLPSPPFYPVLEPYLRSLLLFTQATIPPKKDASLTTHLSINLVATLNFWLDFTFLIPLSSVSE